jgi:hypothetical protein
MVPVELEIEEDAAEALKDAGQRAWMGRLVSRVARLHRGTDPLAETLERTSRAAQASGLTDEEIDSELASYNAERRH